MSIVFFCTKCGSRFEVADSAAGRSGRCKRCGHRIQIPEESEASRSVAAVAVAEAGGEPGAEADGPSWLARMGSQVGLKPLTIERMPGLRKPAPRPTPLDDDLGDSKPYSLVRAWKPPTDALRIGGKPAGRVTIGWRRTWGVIQRFFRRVNEFAYLLSVPFLMLMLIGATAQNRGLALLGAQVVVLLNVGRIVAGLANILAVPFREGLATGLLFLFPPYTIKYMIDHWSKLEKPTRRVAAPILTIGLVALAFAFIPSLSGARKAAVRPSSAVSGR